MSVVYLKPVDDRETFASVEQEVSNTEPHQEILELLGSFRQKNHEGYIPTVVINNNSGNNRNPATIVFNNGEPFTNKDIKNLQYIFKKNENDICNSLSKRGCGLRAIGNKYTSSEIHLTELNQKNYSYFPFVMSKIDTSIQITKPNPELVECSYEKDDYIVYFMGNHDRSWCCKFLDKVKDEVLLECIKDRFKSYFDDYGTGTLVYIPQKLAIEKDDKYAFKTYFNKIKNCRIFVNNDDINVKKPGMIIDPKYHESENSNYLSVNMKIYKSANQYFAKISDVNYLKSTENCDRDIPQNVWIKFDGKKTYENIKFYSLNQWSCKPDEKVLTKEKNNDFVYECVINMQEHRKEGKENERTKFYGNIVNTPAINIYLNEFSIRAKPESHHINNKIKSYFPSCWKYDRFYSRESGSIINQGSKKYKYSVDQVFAAEIIEKGNYDMSESIINYQRVKTQSTLKTGSRGCIWWGQLPFFIRCLVTEFILKRTEVKNEEKNEILSDEPEELKEKVRIAEEQAAQAKEDARIAEKKAEKEEAAKIKAEEDARIAKEKAEKEEVAKIKAEEKAKKEEAAKKKAEEKAKQEKVEKEKAQEEFELERETNEILESKCYALKQEIENRKTISNKTKIKVFSQTNPNCKCICPICDRISYPIPPEMVYGHILAHNKGGGEEDENLFFICKSCNSSMDTMHMLDYVCSYFPKRLKDIINTMQEHNKDIGDWIERNKELVDKITQ